MQEKEEQPQHGGSRKGSGKKPGVTYKEPSHAYTIRIPKTMFEELQAKYGRNLSNEIREAISLLHQKGKG